MTLKFNAWSQDKLRKGVKRLTSRKNHTYDPQVLYDVGPLPWKFIREFLYYEGAEGAKSPEELQTVIDKIYARTGKPVADNDLFIVHVLKEGYELD